MRKEKTKDEFSKKIFNTVITIFIIVIAYSMALMWKTESTDGLMYLIPSVSGLTATCVGFYFWKAKMENMIKLSNDNKLSMDEVKDFESNMDDYDIHVESEDY